MNCWADIGVPSGCQNVVTIMCWMVRALPSASLTLIFWRRGSGSGSRSRRLRSVLAAAALARRLLGLRFDRLAVPFRIVEVVVRLHEIVDREVILAVVEPGAAADDLLELDHRVDRPHQHDVADVAGIDAGRELLRGGQDRRDGLLVVLKVAQVLLAERAVVGRHALAVVRVLARLHLVDEVAHGQGVVLRGAEDQRLLVLVDLLHEQLHAVRFAFLDLDDLVEVGFRVALAGLDLALDQLVVGRVDILVERRGNLLHLERRQEAVVDAVLERIDVDRLAEILVGVHVVLALGRGGQAELHGGGEVVEDAAPVAFVVGAAAMALVDDDEVEEVRRILAEIGRGLAVLRRPAHEGLEDGEEQAAVLGHLALLADVLRLDPHHRILGEGGEGVVGLVGEDVAVGEEQDARAARSVRGSGSSGCGTASRRSERR